MQLFTKERINGIFKLRLEQSGYHRLEAKGMVDLRPYLAERVLAAQTKFVKMFDDVNDADIREFFYTQSNLKKLLARIIEKELEKVLKFPNRIEGK